MILVLGRRCPPRQLDLVSASWEAIANRTEFPPFQTPVYFEQRLETYSFSLKFFFLAPFFINVNK